jgi:hypothetical protein
MQNQYNPDEIVENDTKVFYAVNGGPFPGTPAAIHAKGLTIDTNLGSENFCPHQWLKDGFVDPELERKYPLTAVVDARRRVAR